MPENKSDIYVLLFAIPLALIVSFALINISIQSAVLIIVGVVGIILTLINTDYAIYMLILSMLLSPEFGARPSGGGGMIRFDDLLLTVIVFTWLAKAAIYEELNIFKKTPINSAIGIYILICIISTGIGIIRNDVNIFSGSFFVLKYIEYFILFFMVYNQIRSKEQIKKYYFVLNLTFIFVIIIALSQLPARERLTTPFEGKTGEPNTLGGYLVFLIAVNLSVLLTSDVIESKYLKWGLLVINVAGVFVLLMTKSRGSWVASVPVVIGYIMIHESRTIVLIFSVILLVLSPFIMPDSVIERVKYTFERRRGYGKTLQEEVAGIPVDPSASQRIRSWETAFEEYPKHPILGYGITGWRFLDAQFIRVLIETGIIGLAAFLFLLSKLLSTTWTIYRDSEDELLHALALGFFIGTIALMTHGLGANTFIIIRIMEPFWLMAAIVLSIPKVSEKGEKIQQELNMKITK